LIQRNQLDFDSFEGDAEPNQQDFSGFSLGAMGMQDVRQDNTIIPFGFEALADSQFLWEGNISQQSTPLVDGIGWAPMNETRTESAPDRDGSISTAAAANEVLYQTNSAPIIPSFEAISRPVGIPSDFQPGHVAGPTINIECPTEGETMDGEQTGLHSSFSCPVPECKIEPFNRKGLLT
jgi:hypothetical protein